MKSLSKNNRFLYWGQIIVLGIIVGAGIQLAFAWTGPSQSAPNGNVAGPLTTSGVQQTKSGNLILGNDLAVSRNAVIGSVGSIGQVYTNGFGALPNGWSGIHTWDMHARASVRTNTLCLGGGINGDAAGDCRSAWPTVSGGGVTSITAGTGVTVNQSTGNVTVGINPSSAAAAIFGSATTHTCNLYDSEGSSKNCNIGTKNMCFLVNVFGRDGDDVDGFGCSVVGSPGGNWYLRAVGEDFAQTYCQAMCI